METLSSEKIKKVSSLCGFHETGFSPAKELLFEKEKLKEWISKGYHAEMKFMERNLEKRTNPLLLLENAKTVISVLLSYNQPIVRKSENYKLSLYSMIEDYHDVMQEKLSNFKRKIQEEYTELEVSYFCDSAPIMEKVWAQRSGLGWIGKNGLFISEKSGSFVFIGTLLLNKEVDIYGEPLSNGCGECHLCKETCPTQAIVSDGVIDCNRCISYLTIENKKPFDYNTPVNFNAWIYGCDECQMICPENSLEKAKDKSAFHLNHDIFSMTKMDWNNLTEDNFNKLKIKSTLKRTNYHRLFRNILYLK